MYAKLAFAVPGGHSPKSLTKTLAANVKIKGKLFYLEIFPTIEAASEAREARKLEASGAAPETPGSKNKAGQ